MQEMEMDLAVEKVEVMESHMVEKVKPQVPGRVEARGHFAAAEDSVNAETEQLVLQNYYPPLLSVKTSMVRNVKDLRGLWTSVWHQLHHEPQWVSQKLMSLVWEANDASVETVM
jgi:hypothetical protein